MNRRQALIHVAAILFGLIMAIATAYYTESLAAEALVGGLTYVGGLVFGFIDPNVKVPQLTVTQQDITDAKQEIIAAHDKRWQVVLSGIIGLQQDVSSIFRNTVPNTIADVAPSDQPATTGDAGILAASPAPTP